MFKTRITELLGIQYPMIGGTMMDITLAPFVAAISNAGALGIIASAVFRDPEKLRLEIRKTRELTDKPFAVNINLFPQMNKPDNRALLDVLFAEGVRIVETSGHQIPADLAALFKQYGMTWIHKCVGVRYAEKAASLGADAVTVVGYENGGATGILNITTLVLVPSVVDAIQIPVVGGGGVADGRGLYAVLALDAEAAIIGSRFVLSDECPVHPNLKKALCEADELSTDLIMFSVGFTHRVWMNEAARKTLEIEKRGGSLEEIMPYVSGEAARKMYKTGDLNAGTISISQGIGIPKKIMPVRDIVEEMIGQAQSIHKLMEKMGMA